MLTSAQGFSEGKYEKPVVVCYSFNLSNIVFQTSVSHFSRMVPLFFSCVTNLVSDNYFIFQIIFILSECFSCRNASHHPQMSSAEIQARYATARDATHSRGICSYMGKARTLNIPYPQEHSGLAFLAAAALSHNRQRS